MSHTTPASFLVWSWLSCMLGIFLIYHLWSFDRFKCLRWNNGPYSGAFKRIMTYSYLLSVPLIIAYAVGFAVIKYKEGYIQLPFVGIIPKPYELWTPTERSAIFPLTLCFSLAWSLEMVTHLEELCFWLFLVNAKANGQDWFRSYYFRTWMVGSLVAVIYMPLVAIFTRHDPYKNEAFTFLAGSLGSLSLTVWFMPILWTFPGFLNNLRSEGVDSGTIVRLTKFHELNTIRIIFRYLFTVPFLVLGVDGIRPHQHINSNYFWTDLLTALAGVGCVVSSGITLVIFFPRSVEGEIAARDASTEKKRLRSSTRATDFGASMSEYRPSYNVPSYTSHAKTHYSLYSHDLAASTHELSLTPLSEEDKAASGEEYALDELHRTSPPAIRPNRKRGDDVELGGIGPLPPGEVLTEANLSKHNIRSSVNPIIHSYTSPINMVYTGNVRSESSRLTFTKRPFM
ncbi:hypothetical protein GYMLUDRAFT_43375 [Collybiopsis luxurians FD-317 M1]|uniref:Uncharacterized protein n=1 Tax=Collybiopsis luxurians FD-317 M1 TaxID=944289 RepID=A0A0D0CX53_9AGAR|nr:hypothetical protein GYMLUDRAFT_43375 [Collybiopsis luxurians FD-317 M1]